MAILKTLLIRALAVTLVAFLLEIIVDGFEFGNTVDHLLDTGLPIFLGLTAFAAFGPKTARRVHKAMYPVLYALAVHFVLTNLFGGGEDRPFLNFWRDGVRIPIGLILAVPTLYLLDAVWRPKPGKDLRGR